MEGQGLQKEVTVDDVLTGVANVCDLEYESKDTFSGLLEKYFEKKEFTKEVAKKFIDDSMAILHAGQGLEDLVEAIESCSEEDVIGFKLPIAVRNICIALLELKQGILFLWLLLLYFNLGYHHGAALPSSSILGKEIGMAARLPMLLRQHEK